MIPELRNIATSRAAAPDSAHPEGDRRTGLPERPLIFPGTLPPPKHEDSSPPLLAPPKNRPHTRRRISAFYIILGLFAAATASILYISNIIAVNHLVAEIDALQKRHQQILHEQEILKAEINRLSSLERINRRAAEDLGLVNPKEPPVWISVDRNMIMEVEKALSAQPQ